MDQADQKFSFKSLVNQTRGVPFNTFLICLVAVTLSNMDQALFSYAVPGISSEFGVSLKVIGWILSISFLVASFAVVCAGVLTDFFGRRKMFLIMMTCSAFFVGCHSLADNITLLAVFRVLGFAFAAGLYPITATIVIEVAPARYRGMMSAWLQMSYPVGFALGALISSNMLDAFGWRGTFYPAFLVIFVALILGKLLKETDRFESSNKKIKNSDMIVREANSRSVLSHLGELLSPQFRNRTIICFIATICSNIAIAGTVYFLPTFLTQDRGISESEAASLLVWTWMIAAIGYVIASYVGEFILTRRDTVIIGIIGGAILFGITLWTFDQQSLVILGLGISTMFFFASESMRMALVGEIYPTRLRATASSSVGSLAVTTASLIAPLLITFTVPLVGWTWTFTLIGVIPLLIGGLIFTLLENFPTGVEIERLSN